MVHLIGKGLEALKSWMQKCLDAGGVPIVRTRYGGRRLPNDSVIVACWGKGSEVRGGTVEDIPPEIINKMEKTKGDYKWILGLT